VPALTLARRTPIVLIGDTLNSGGTEGQFVEVVCGLDRSRWDISAACMSAKGALRPQLEKAGCRPWSCGPRSFKSPGFFLAIASLARFLRRHRVRLVHTFEFYSNMLGIPAARLAGVPAILASQRDLGNLRSPLEQRLHRAILRLADRILVNSSAVAARVQAYRGLSADRVALVRNGIDLSRFRTSARSASVAGRLTVGTLTNLRSEKGVDDLVRAAAIVQARCPAARFVVWGDGPERPALEHLVRALGVDGILELRGRTSTPEAALRELDVFVLPSLSEASSNALLEAMASGVPVVATRVGGNVEMLDGGRSGMLVPPASPSALAAAILSSAGEPALARERAARARQRVESEFDRARMLADLENLYDMMLAGKDRRGLRDRARVLTKRQERS
jgi:glycosyltransferase involved in cell wall biosynthesis